MKKEIVEKINKLNLKFYSDLSDQFSSSRNYYWKGWNKLIEIDHINILKDSKIKILDVGCGNGRFAKFMIDRGFNIDYTGIDFSNDLLNSAGELLKDLREDNDIKLIETDLMSYDLKKEKFQLIVLFGVLHHIPGGRNRKALIKDLADKLDPGGLMVFTVWDFMNEEKFIHRSIDPTIVGIDEEEIEKNDFILDWRRDGHGYRYCHYTSSLEADEICKNTHLNLVDKFRADGRSGELNRYYVLKK